MTKEDIMRMAEASGVEDSLLYEHWRCNLESMTAFANLVAQHERDKFCAVLRQLHDSYSLASDSNAIRARGQV